MKVTVTSGRNTVYQKAHRTAVVLLTERVQDLIDEGVLEQVSEGSTYVSEDREGNTTAGGVITAPSKGDLIEQATELGVDVKASWSKSRILTEIEGHLEDGGAPAPAVAGYEHVEPEDAPEVHVIESEDVSRN